MTSTSAPSRPVDDASDPPARPPLRALRDHGPGPAAPRRRSRFPAAPEGPGAPAPRGPARALWLGGEGALREQVADHATAAGLELADAPGDGEAAAQLIGAGALGEDAALVPGAGTTAPLLVLTAEETVSAATWREALAAGARAVIELPGGSDLLLSHLTELARPRRTSLMIGVCAGHGGAGASSFAARLAAAARSPGPVVLADADPLGGGLDLLVEQPGAAGVGWADLEALGPQDGAALRAGLPVVDGVSLLVAGEHAGPQGPALARALTALAPLGGVVVVDLAPSLVPVAAEHLDQLLVVTTASDHGVRAAARRMHGWHLPAGLAEAVVRRRGPLTPAEVAEDLSLPVAAVFRDSAAGTVPLLDVRRRGADRAARLLLAELSAEAGHAR